MSIRSATHAGSWYPGTKKALTQQLTEFFSKAEQVIKEPIKALICPHAGYVYSAPTAAYAWKNVQPDKQKIDRVFVLGPSHHEYFKGCMLTSMQEYSTPLGNLVVDTETNKKLHETKKFEKMSKSIDEEEHSIELHMPFIVHALGTSPKIVPILVGEITKESALEYGKILSPFLNEENTLFVISSDFCHWGYNFGYTTVLAKNKEDPLWKSIENLDKLGMEMIETLEAEKFSNYLDKYSNTICGRNPILILMNAANPEKQQMKFVHYAQSNKVKSKRDMSVSYAAGCLFEK
ncbi:protein memo1 [Anaeramoeba ignava]|uniref:Protein memo1 n=1 Tax=Anaeramoeba ignava TaxID=1746090 RepID=A0A9Q0LSJ4_ANAIG|nr:protein memo1 [Anaeramoeba ignava]